MLNFHLQCYRLRCFSFAQQEGGFGGCTPVPKFHFCTLGVFAFWQFGAVSLLRGGPRPSVLPELRLAVY